MLSFFCAGLERVDGTKVLGKLDRIRWRETSEYYSFTSLEVQLVTPNACGYHMYILW